MIATILLEKPQITKAHDETIITNGYFCECGHKTFMRRSVHINMSANRPAEEWEMACMRCQLIEIIPCPS